MSETATYARRKRRQAWRNRRGRIYSRVRDSCLSSSWVPFSLASYCAVSGTVKPSATCGRARGMTRQPWEGCCRVPPHAVG